MAFRLSSGAFRNGAAMPKRHAHEGENLSPPLRWEDAPEETKSFALIVEDPDAPSGTCRHWAIYNIDAGANDLPEGVLPENSRRPATTPGRARYDGPKPPKGHRAHRNHFRLAALDVPSLEVRYDASTLELWRAAEPHILAEAEFVGTYETT